ncbi:DUF58 domain-containing protein [Zavarzinella formosa]|uniref:DUF58 domain-containing protein n=1 Tax=Zavarzinella formosa TaxID=360055 RepID=UPI0003053148|nr:DUF58 domain-containing protein [Zavarzinella formosa]
MSATIPLLEPEFLARLQRLEIVSRKIFLGKTKGERLSKRKGQSVEFADFRNYCVGDDLRFLDWNLFARLDRLFLRIFLEEEDLHVYLLVDNSLSMGFGSPAKLHYAKQVAAALGFVALCNMDRVVVEGFNDKPAGPPALRGRRTFWRLTSFLDTLEPAGAGDFSQALKTFSMKASGKGVVVILSDFLDKGGYETGLRYLLARNMDIYVIQILAPEEVDPPMTGDLKLTDIEDGDMAEVTISAPLLKRYKETLNAFRGKLQDFCTRRGINYLFTTTQVPFDRLVLNYLRNRGLVR